MEGLMTQHIMEPTRWRDGQEANPLDLIFTNKDGLISDIEVPAPVGKSDHGVILFKMTKWIYTDQRCNQWKTLSGYQVGERRSALAMPIAQLLDDFYRL